MSQDVGLVCDTCQVYAYECGGMVDWRAELAKFQEQHPGHATRLDWHDGLHFAVLDGAMPYVRIPWTVSCYDPD